MTESSITPRSNPRLFGHETAINSLWEDYQAGKLAHGWIISGPRGIGKATLANHFARALLAGEDSLEVDESHPTFQRMLADSHTDFRIIEPEYDAKKEEYAREISVDQAREIAQFLRLTPGESQWRVVIVDSIDQLNVNAANAILKILEEPPAQALLILISHNPGKLLPTIRSRCRSLRLHPLEEKTFSRVLRHAAPQIESKQLPALSELSGHAPGVAIELAEQGALELYTRLLDIMGELPAVSHAKVHKLADEIGTGAVHRQWALFVEMMLLLMARAAKCAAGSSLTEIVQGEGGILTKLAASHSAGAWASRWQASQEELLLASARHLDYKQVIISYFHSLSGEMGKAA